MDVYKIGTSKFDNIKIDNSVFDIFNVPGDGNCFFHCLSFLIHGNFSASTMFRNLICGMIYENWTEWREKVALFHSPSFSRDIYEDGMIKSNWFASACEIEAAAVLLASKINIWLMGKNNCGQLTYNLTTFSPSSGNFQTTLNLLLVNEHYMVLKPVPTSEIRIDSEVSVTNTCTNNVDTNVTSPLYTATHIPDHYENEYLGHNKKQKTVHTSSSDDELLHICRKLGIWSSFESPKPDESKHEKQCRTRRIKYKIKNQESKTGHLSSELPDAPPLSDNEQFNKALDCIRAFEIEQMSYRFVTCDVCTETRLSLSVLKKNACKRCSFDKNQVKMFSKENNMDPGDQPSELKNLTIVEQQLIAQISPCMNVFMLRHGGIASSGHCVTFPQEVNEPAKIFPRLPSEIEILKVCKQGKNNTTKDFKVSRSRVEKALVWLKQKNPAYSDITISQSRLLLLPEDGELDAIPTAVCSNNPQQINDLGPAPNQVHVEGLDENCQSISGVLFQDKNVNLKQKVKDVVNEVMGETKAESVTQNKSGIVTIPWPTRSSEPLSEFTTQYFFTMAFPCLFPYGNGDFHVNRPRTCSSLGDWAEHLLWYKDGRFAKHQYFKFVAHNMILRKQAVEKGSFIVRQKLGDPHLTVSDIKHLLEQGGDSISRKILYFSDTIRGTSQYWARRYKEVQALEHFKINNGDGLPSFFTTGSCAEFHFKPLRRLLSLYVEKTSGITFDPNIPSEMFKTLQENTHIVAKYFDLRTQSYFENVLGPVFGVETYWYRQEFAKSRGMVHWHGLCWRSDKEPHKLLHQCVEAGLSDSQCATELAKWAKFEFGLSAEHPAGYNDLGNSRKYLWPPPEGTAPAPPEEKNPLVKLLMDVSDSQETLLEDYLLLTNRFNLHRCSDYCLKPNKYRPSLKECRMEFGNETTPGKKLQSQPEIVKDKNGSLRLELKRDHPMLVQHSRVHTQGWRANGDISLILSKSGPENPSVGEIIATEKYITGYACKGNQTTEALSDLFNEMVDLSAGSNETAKSFCQKYLINTVKRDVSAVEVSYELSRLPLYRCSHTFQSISLSGFRVLEKDGSVVTKNTALDNYLCRHPNDECSFYQFVSRNGKVPVFSNSLQASWPLNEKYCEFQLLLHFPNWRKPSDIKSHDVSWIDAMEKFLLSDICPNFVKADVERSKFKSYIPTAEDSDTNIYVDISSQQPEWLDALRPDMHFDALQTDLDFDDGGIEYDWSQNFSRYPCDLGKTFIDKLADVHHRDDNIIIPNVDLQNMNHDQLFAFNIVLTTVLKHKNGNSFEPLRLVVSGTAGSGKSYLIKCIVKAVRKLYRSNKAIQVICPTGNSANLINGVTIHSFLKIPVHGLNKEMLAPEGTLGENLQKNLEGLKILIVDERSMVGATTLGWMEFMCRHGIESGKNSDFSWGGLPAVVFLGDDVQLPPVLDSPVYRCKSNTPAALHGVIVWQEFTTSVMLQTIIRQQESEILLKETLLALRSYECTTEQCEWLQKFQWQNIEKKYGKNAVEDIHNNGLFVFPTHTLVWEHNKNKLLDLNKLYPVAKITAEFKGRHAANTSNNNSLASTLYLCKNAKVMLTVNLAVRFGLFNGSLGIVRDIIYLNGRRPDSHFPDAVMVEFSSYTGPTFMDNDNKLVPIVPVERKVDCACHGCKRKQIPLRLGWATTIHKCQGMTVGAGEPNRYIVIDPGNKTFEARNPGALFVSLSRAKSSGSNNHPPDFAWNPSVLANQDRICYKVCNSLTVARDKEIKRLQKMSETTRNVFKHLISDKTIAAQFLGD